MPPELFLNIFIKVQLTYKVMLISGEQPSDSAMHIPLSILFHILFHSGLLQAVEYSSLCYTVGPCCLLYTQLCICHSIMGGPGDDHHK